MKVYHANFQESPESRRAPIVDGKIFIEGTFSREEWERIKDMFLAHMLSIKPQRLDSKQLTTRKINYLDDQFKKQD